MTGGTPSFFKTHPRVCALVLAASKGSRLFPMTSSEMPKHLLPIAGIPNILRLLEGLAYVPQIVIAVSAEDSVTAPLLQTSLSSESSSTTRPTDAGDDSIDDVTIIPVKGRAQTITVIKLSAECLGPVDALREVEESKLVHPATRLVVIPGDLVLLQKDISLDALMRPPSESDCAVLLVDVGEVDEHGAPLKESAKVRSATGCPRTTIPCRRLVEICFLNIVVVLQAKKGSFSRDEEDIEYIGLSYASKSMASEDSSSFSTSLPRIVLKQSKRAVEADEDMTGSTAKLQVPKARLRPGKFVVRTSWNDVHVYSLAPWIRELLMVRKGLSSLQEDLLPLLVSRQFRGKKATFGKSLDGKEAKEEKENASNSIPMDDTPYSVSAMVLPSKTVMRANTISAFHYVCRETVANGSTLTMPIESKWNGKFQTLVLRDSTIGAKINMKSSVVGKNCQLGAKCRLNNVIIMDNVSIGENCSLQNTLIGMGAKLGNNCSLNDCQVGPGKEISSGTKEKGESFMVGDAIVEDLL